MRSTREPASVLFAAFAVLASFASAEAAPEGEPLARRLPARTVLYVELDVGSAAKGMLDYLRFLDPDHVEGVEFGTREFIACLKEFAAQHEFTPRAFDEIAESRLHFVIMALDEPVVKTRTFNMPKWDRETGERIEGEFEERTRTTRKEYSMSLVAELPSDESATDFLDQFKGLQERLAEGETDGEHGWREVEVDEGEMIGWPDDDDVLGRLGNLLVLSDTKPVELWAALTGEADPCLADSPVYVRLRGDGDGSVAFVQVNLAVLIEKLQESLLRDLEEAEEKFGPAQTGAGAGAPNPGAFHVRAAQMALETFMLFEKLLSLDKVDAAGMSWGFRVGDGSAASQARLALHMSEPVSPLVELIFGSGRQLEAPPVGERDGIALMLRLGLKEVFASLSETLPPQYMHPVAAAGGILKMQVGYDMSEILEAVAGDVYAHVDFTRKEMDNRRWDPETEQVVTEKVVMPVPELLFLLGIEDAEAFSRMLSDIFTRVKATFGPAAGLGKRTFLASDVYLFGSRAGEEGAEPDGTTSFAAAVVGRRVAVGSWKDVTGLVRRAGNGDEAVGRFPDLIAAHPRANLFAFVPGTFNQKIRDLLKEDGKDPYDELRKELENLDDLPVEDEELRKRFRDAFRRLLDSLLELARKSETGSVGMHAFGERRDEFYEILLRSEVRK